MTTSVSIFFSVDFPSDSGRLRGAPASGRNCVRTYLLTDVYVVKNGRTCRQKRTYMLLKTDVYLFLTTYTSISGCRQEEGSDHVFSHADDGHADGLMEGDEA